MRLTLLQVVGVLAIALIACLAFMAAGAMLAGVVAAALIVAAGLWLALTWVRRRLERTAPPRRAIGPRDGQALSFGSASPSLFAPVEDALDRFLFA